MSGVRKWGEFSVAHGAAEEVRAAGEPTRAPRIF